MNAMTVQSRTLAKDMRRREEKASLRTIVCLVLKGDERGLDAECGGAARTGVGRRYAPSREEEEWLGWCLRGAAIHA
jgi:hypothetical protein